MVCQLPTECLNKIFEYLVDEDNLALHSCLLVNRFWCKIVVRILWRNIFNFKSSYRHSFTLRRSLRVETSILSTLIACLPNESKELLYKNKIFISTPTSNPPLFNYSELCKVLSINKITEIVNDVLKHYNNDLVANEIIKMFTNQISSLKKFTYFYNPKYHLNISFPYAPAEAKNLSELCCSSNLSLNFFYQLSLICHNLQSISISFENDVSNELSELKELISSQNNLKNLTFSASHGNSWTNIIPSLIKHSHTIIKLQLYGFDSNLPFSFISSFTNLQELTISFVYGVDIKDFEKLQHASFSKLENLKIPYQSPKNEIMMKYLENNGNNLKKFYLGQNNKALNLFIANSCPKIKRLFVTFNRSEVDIFKNILISCNYLESITVWCGNYYLSEKDVLDTIVNYSSNNFHELEIHISKFNISPKDLESFFVSWSNRTPKKLFSLIFTKTSTDEENLKLIEKYENLGIIKFYIKQLNEYFKEVEIDFFY